jgi:hypothetical protein
MFDMYYRSFTFQTSANVAEYNVISMFHEIATGKPYVLPEQKEEIEKPSGPTVTGIICYYM